MPLPSPLNRSPLTRPKAEWLRSRDPNDGTPTPPPTASAWRLEGASGNAWILEDGSGDAWLIE